MKKYYELLALILSSLLFITCDKQQVIPNDEPPSDWFFKQRAYPYADINTKAYLNALNNKKQNIINRKSPPAFDQNWTFIGPSNIGGRITDIEMWPDDLNTILAGSASGGIFKSEDQGQTWRAIFDDAASLAIGDMSISTSNPDVIFVGTGEANSGGGSLAYDGLGVYRSDNKGESWTHVGLDGVGSIGRVAINPKNEQEVYVAAMGRLFGQNPERGIYRTINGGDTWDHILSVNDSTGGIDLVIHQDQPDTLFAAMWERSRRPNDIIYGGEGSGIYRSFDGGDNWERLENGLPEQNTEMGRIALAIAPSNQNRVVAFVAAKSGFIQGIYISDDLGNSWTEIPNIGVRDVSYQWWFSKIFIDPIDADKLLLASFNMHDYHLGDQSWEEIFKGTHVDQHALFVHPLDTEFVVIGNDGGVYISYDAGENYIKSEDLPNIQFYTCEVDPNDSDIVYGGTQDNGTYKNIGDHNDTWQFILGGDGFRVASEPGFPNLFYCEYQNGNAFRTLDGGLTLTSIIPSIDPNDRNNWNTPLAIDYNEPTRIYYGTERIWRSNDRGDNFFPISEDLSNGPYEGNRTFGTIVTIESSVVNSNIIYVGTDDGNVWNSLDDGISWSQINPEMNIARWTTAVLPDPVSENIAYVSFSGFRYDSNDGSIYKTINNGESWIDITGDLPDVPVNDIQIDPRDNSLLFAATDIGVYYSINEGLNWEVLGQELPNVPVVDIDISNDGKLVAATYGRSMYYYLVPDLVNNVNLHPSKVKIFPNPTTDYIIVEIDDAFKDYTFSMINRKGEVIIRDNLINEKISVRHLPRAVYYVSIRDKRGKIVSTKLFFKI